MSKKEMLSSNQLRLPAEMKFSESESINPYVTKGKLKVFYVGSTGDGRVFTESFSKQLLNSLPLTPVVGFFDYEGEDFLGHWFEQNVYGFVPEDAEIGFVEEDGVKWAVTDVILFTGRDDNIGYIARQIEGKPQSLELAPHNLEYDITVDEDGQSTITFHSGRAWGLSVLGANEQPAFDGAHFFSETEEGIAAVAENELKLESQVEKLVQLYKDFTAIEAETDIAEEAEEVEEEDMAESADVDKTDQEAAETTEEELEESIENIEAMSVEEEAAEEEEEEAASYEETAPEVETEEEVEEETVNYEQIIADYEATIEDYSNQIEELKSENSNARAELDALQKNYSDIQEQLAAYHYAEKIDLIEEFSEFLKPEEVEMFKELAKTMEKEDLRKELSVKGFEAVTNASNSGASKFSILKINHNGSNNKTVDKAAMLIEYHKDK